MLPFNRHCEPTGRRKAPPDDRLREAIHLVQPNGLLRRFAPRNDDGHGKRKWQKQRQPGVSPPANACAEKFVSRSTRPRAGPGTIIRRRAGARMARLMRPMSEAGASVFASP